MPKDKQSPIDLYQNGLTSSLMSIKKGKKRATIPICSHLEFLMAYKSWFKTYADGHP